jgi:uncharacterized membrane protein YfcA
MSEGTTPAVMAIVAAAMFTRSAFGFGHGAFAMPLLALVIDVRAATPLLAAVSFLVSVAILVGDRRSLRIGSTAALTGGALVGLPIGIALVAHLDPKPAMIVLAVLLAIVSVRGVAGVSLPMLRDDRSAPVFGLLAGIVGGAFNLSGIPVALFGSMRRWSPGEFRTSLTGFFFVTGVVALAGYVVGGLFDRRVLDLVVWSLIPAFLGHWAGTRANRSMDQRRFDRWIWAIILFSSLVMLVRLV